MANIFLPSLSLFSYLWNKIELENCRIYTSIPVTLVARIQYYDHEQVLGWKAILTHCSRWLQFRNTGEDSTAAGPGSWLLTCPSTHREQRKRIGNGSQAVNFQSPYPVMYFFQQGCTSQRFHNLPPCSTIGNQVLKYRTLWGISFIQIIIYNILFLYKFII